MVSSPVNNNHWSYRVPANQAGNGAIRLYGDANIMNHQMHPGNWAVGWSIKTITGATINVRNVVYGRATVGIWYPDGLGAEYDIYFPQGQEIDNVTAYALDHDQNILYIQLNGSIYSVNLNDAHEHGDEGEFVVW
jgi:hypothetical protein